MQKNDQRRRGNTVDQVRERSDALTGERYCPGCHLYRKRTAFAATSRRCDACAESAAARRKADRR